MFFGNGHKRLEEKTHSLISYVLVYHKKIKTFFFRPCHLFFHNDPTFYELRVNAQQADQDRAYKLYFYTLGTQVGKS